MIHWVIFNESFFLVFLACTSICAGLVLIHPYPLNKTLAETSGLLGTEYGFLIGCWIRLHIFKESITYMEGCSYTQWALLPLFKSIFGLMFVYVVDTFSKKLIRQKIVDWLGSEYEITGQTIAKYIGYTCTTLGITTAFPLIWEYTVSNVKCV